MAGRPFESWIQDLVYNVDVGVGVRIIKLILSVFAVLAVVAWLQVFEFKGLKNQEAMDYAQLGRNLSMSGTLVTQNVRPASMWYLMKNRPDQDPQIDFHPDIVHAPAYAAALAAAFKLAGTTFSLEGPPGVFAPERWVVLPVCYLFAIFAGFLLYRLALILFEPRVALLATVCYFVSSSVWMHGMEGTTISMATFFVTGTLYCAARVGRLHGEHPESKQVYLWVGLTGVACALAFLTRYGTVVLVPSAVAFFLLINRQRGWTWAIIVLVVFLAGVSPWLLRNKSVSGGFLGLAPYTALNETGMFPADTFERTFQPGEILKSGSPFRAIQAKWMTHTQTFFQEELLTTGDGVMICFFLVAFLYRFVRNDVHWFRWAVALAMVLLIVLAGYFGTSTAALLHTFLPIILVYAAAFFFLLLDRLQLRARVYEYGVVGAIVLLTGLPFVVTLLPPRPVVPYPPYFPPYIAHVSRMLGPDELMCTDMPWATAWYGGRTSISLPATIDEFYQINDYHRRINGLYFTTLTRDKPYIRTLATGEYKSWFPIFEGRLPADFPLTQGFPIHNLDQLFLTDRVRWGT